MKKHTTYILFLLTFSTLFSSEPPKGDKNAGKKLSNSSIYDNGTNVTYLNINNWKIQMENQGFFAWNGTSHGSAGNYPIGMGSVIFAEGLLWGAKVSDKYGVDGNGQILTDGSGSGTPRIRVNGSMYNTGLKAGKVLRDADGRIKTSDYSQDFRNQQIWRVRRDWNTADLIRDASIIKNIDYNDVTEAQIADIRNQYESDWIHWPAHEGAPFDDVNGDGVYTPATWDDNNGNWQGDIPGITGADQTVWTVANDLPDEYTESGIPVSVSEGGWGSPPIGFEIQITLWGYTGEPTNPLANMIFKRARINYVGLPGGPADAKLDTLYITQWADPDLGVYTDDFVGSDTTRSLGYVYNGNTFDDQFFSSYGSPVPAAGYDFLEGPKVDTDGDGTKETTLGMTSFVYFAAGSSVSDPSTRVYVGTLHWFNLMEGYLPRPEYPTQEPFVDPLTGYAEKFVLAGDPPTGTGWIDGIILPPGDRRIAMNTGPFEMVVGDTQDVVIGLIGGMGADNLTSIEVLKYHDDYAQFAYDNDFNLPSRPATMSGTYYPGDKEIFVEWNNNDNRYRIESNNGHNMHFEGYELWQFPDSNSWKNKDLEKAILFQSTSHSGEKVYGKIYNKSTGLVNQTILHGGTRGVERSARIKLDYLTGDSLKNGNRYYYGLRAFAKSRNSSKEYQIISNTMAATGGMARFSAVPNNGVYGLDYKDPTWYVNTDTSGFSVGHEAGNSDGVINVRITNPANVRGGNYQVTFVYDSSTSAVRYTLKDRDTQEELLSNMYVRTADQPAQWFGNGFGFEVDVMGPPNAFKNFLVVANKGPYDDGQGNIQECTEDTPCQGAQDWGGFPTAYTNRVNQSDGYGWFFHGGGASAGSYVAMIDRIIRGSGWNYLIPHDFEYRWTYEDDNYAYAAYTTGSLIRVPFEIWNLTYNERLIPWFNDYDGNEAFGLHPNDHPGSGGSNDPHTDWIYPRLPAIEVGGDAGYYEWLEDSKAKGVENGGPDTPNADGHYIGADYYSDKVGPEIMGRNVFYVWNLDDVNDGSIDAFAGEDIDGDGVGDNKGPEKGTVLRIVTTKAVQANDVFAFTLDSPKGFDVSKGDVNADSTIDVTDVVMLVDHIIEIAYLPGGKNEFAADYNEDYEINIADGVGIINKILGINGKLNDENMRLKSVNPVIALNPVIEDREGQYLVSLDIEKGAFSGIEFNLDYASDLKLNPRLITINNNLNLVKEFYSKEDGSSRFVIMTMDGSSIEAGDRIQIIFDHGNNKKDSKAEIAIKIKNVVLSSSTGQSKTFTINNSLAELKVIPDEFNLHPSYPNPFNPTTMIPYDIAVESFVTISVIDILGREVATIVNENKLAGKHQIMWNGKSNAQMQLPTGIYFVKLKAGNFVSIQKITLLK